MLIDYYAYNELTFAQNEKCTQEGRFPAMYRYDEYNLPPLNEFRTMGVDYRLSWPTKTPLNGETPMAA